MRYVTMMTLIILGLFLSSCINSGKGDVERGKSLFNDPALSGSTNEDSCNTCHSNGSGMEKAGSKEFTVFMDSKVNSLEDVINICIEQPLEGKTLSKDSQDMKDIVAYIKSLGAK